MVSTFLDRLPPHSRRFAEAAWARRSKIAGFVLGVAVIATIVSLLLPKWFTARATVLPPAEGSDAFGVMAGMIQTSALNKLGLFSTSTPSDVFAEILRSRTLGEELIHKFDLQRLYRAKNLDLALRELEPHVQVDVNKAGVLEIAVEDRDPSRASDMANHLVFMLDRFNRETYVTKAKRTRQFLESRLTDVTARMASADSTLAAYERKNKTLTSTNVSAIDGAASVIAQKMGLQVRRSYVSSYRRPDSPELRAIDAEMAAFDREIAKLPGMKQEGARLALEAEIQRKVFTILTAQYEEARVQETRDTPTLTVLDAARPPLLKSRPRRALIVVASAAAALILGLAWVGFEIRTPSRA